MLAWIEALYFESHKGAHVFKLSDTIVDNEGKLVKSETTMFHTSKEASFWLETQFFKLW
jgi:hypothetical protein